MADVSWLEDAMEKAGYEYNKDLAEKAGVSAATVGRALKRGSVRDPTAEKLQEACGNHAIGPYTDLNKISSGSEGGIWNPPNLNTQECLKRFEGSDCPTSSKTCAGCFAVLEEELDYSELPLNRAVCRLKHGWTVEGGILYYRRSDGVLITADELKEDSNES